jgi:uncharacterized protein (UPF0333 family)
MFRKLIKNKKAQNTAEYAILISLVVAGIIAMQTYAQRALQARVRDAAHYLADQSGDLGNTLQYEPYYLKTNYLVTRNDNETTLLDSSKTRKEIATNRTRGAKGFQESLYNGLQAD